VIFSPLYPSIFPTYERSSRSANSLENSSRSWGERPSQCRARARLPISD
jgi:hypothetical protein